MAQMTHWKQCVPRAWGWSGSASKCMGEPVPIVVIRNFSMSNSSGSLPRRRVLTISCAWSQTSRSTMICILPFSGARGFISLRCSRGRQIQLQSCYIHRVDVQGRAKELPDTHMNQRFLDEHFDLADPQPMAAKSISNPRAKATWSGVLRHLGAARYLQRPVRAPHPRTD